jgi:hypothetical protein
MRIDGEWYECDDGIVRPVVRGEVRNAAGSWVAAEFLLDTGADRTVLSAAVLSVLGLSTAPPEDRIGGVGGTVDSVIVKSEIRLTRDGDGKVLFRGEFAAVTALESLDMSVLGRDITDLFAVVMDRPGGVVCLLSQSHGYHVTHE